jgi:D-glycero-D-manno-heptose 1,7-bisphosphate phosphatase
MKPRAVFLDRDGVLVRELVRDGRAVAPVTLENFHVVDGARRQVERLRDAGLVPIVFTNQPEVARGLLTEAVLDAMHARLSAEVPIVDVFVCPHDEDDRCACRKPKPGMLEAAAARWGLELARSFVVGDRWRDIDAGRAVGCFSVLLERSYSECASAHTRVRTLEEAVDVILTELGEGAS